MYCSFGKASVKTESRVYHFDFVNIYNTCTETKRLKEICLKAELPLLYHMCIFFVVHF